MTGRQISHYRILEKLGQGGMGVVYKAHDTSLDRCVAIKVLPPERVADPERKRRFVQEAKAASALNHPNIVTIHDIGRAGGVDFIVMEYVAGKTLSQLIPRGGLQLNTALKYGVQIADAFAAAHAAGIVHRDLKPGNVMVNDRDPVKVLDFGLAKLAGGPPPNEDEATQTAKPRTGEGVIAGTIAYMSPEQAEGKSVDARSDIFSFGSLLYEMIAGRPPFHGNTPVATLAAILNEQPPALPAGTPHDLERIISRCLRKDPERRFQHMDDVKIALEELREESDSSGLALAAPTNKPVRRMRWRRWAVGVALLAAITSGWHYLRRAKEPSMVTSPLTS